jgi:hypothetical protein
MLRLLTLTALFIFLHVPAPAGNLWGIDHSLFVIKPHTPGSSLNMKR